MQKVIGILLLVALGIALLGCGEETHLPSAIQGTQTASKINLEVSQTLGNHSYVPLNLMNEEGHSHIDEILQVLDAFELRHPEFEITSWKLESVQRAESTPAAVYGIWIDHRLKPQHELCK